VGENSHYLHFLKFREKINMAKKVEEKETMDFTIDTAEVAEASK